MKRFALNLTGVVLVSLIGAVLSFYVFGPQYVGWGIGGALVCYALAD